jgi:hypothetical protein
MSSGNEVKDPHILIHHCGWNWISPNLMIEAVWLWQLIGDSQLHMELILTTEHLS